MTAATTWLDLPADHPFGVHNLPYGVFSTAGAGPRVGVCIGDHVLDAGPCAERAGMESGEVWLEADLNRFLGEGRPAWDSAREWLVEVLTNELMRDSVEPHLVPTAEVTMHLPFRVADYVDFYAGEHHASNVGKLFRPDSPALPPNWKHLPIGYHGRAGTVVVSGTEVVRPTGQRKAPADPAGHRGRAGLRRGLRHRARDPRRRRRGSRAPVRGGAAQRLERARHPGLGVRPARPLPRQVVRHEHLALGGDHGGPRDRTGPPPRPGPRAAALPAW
jgi:hypothetical protein